MHKKLLFLILFSVVIFQGGCMLKTKSSYGGFYTLGERGYETPFGEAYIYPENDSTLLFYMFTNKGAPSYDRAEIKGRASIKDGHATFHERFDNETTDCTIYFSFDGDQLVVCQENDECGCGFGQGIYIDGIFERKSSEIPDSYKTLSGDIGYFKQWDESHSDDSNSPFSGMNSEFTAYFPDIVPGKEPETRTLLPKDIVNRFLSDQLQYENEEGETFYAVGKIMGYRGMNMLICDYEANRSDEDTYDNHVDGIRLLLLYHQDGTPVLTDKEGDGTIRKVFSLSNHYYGEGGESSTQSHFDRDTTLITHELHSECESATGYSTPLISEIEYRWRVNEQGGKELLESRKVEFSSPFYNLSFLQKQKWDAVSDDEFNSTFPTQKTAWELTMPESVVFPVKVSFYIEWVDGVLIPVFESCDNTPEGGRILDIYRVGQARIEEQPSSESYKRSDKLQCSFIIKTSDGLLEVLPSGKFKVYQ